MLHWFWAVLSLIFSQHAVNTAITGPAASTNPLSHTSLPFLQCLRCFHLLLYTNKHSHHQKQDSCKNHPVAWKNTQRGPWTHRTAPHSRFHPGPSGLNKTPLQHCQGQDFCLVTALELSESGCRWEVCLCVSTADDSSLTSVLCIPFSIFRSSLIPYLMFTYCLMSLIGTLILRPHNSEHP